MKRYEMLADELALSIRYGVFAPGTRLPSVRQLSTSRGVSMSTVFEAYYLLEARGQIRARARSGYYVCAATADLPPEPLIRAECGSGSQPVAISELVFGILASAKARDVAPLGSAFPSPELFPLPRLARSLARGVETMDPWDTVDDMASGHAALRRQIATRYMADGVMVQPEDIVITSGAMEALSLCLLAVTRPGDAVVIESPTFYGALQALEILGLNAIEVPSCPRGGIDLERLRQALDEHAPAACWLMTNFQNPLGSLMTDEHKQALVALLAAHKVPLIEDDVYGELYFGRRRPLPAKAYDRQGLVLHCSSFSKCLAPGYRVGWAIAGVHSPRVARLKLMRTLSVAAPLQAGLSDYLAGGGFDRHLRQLRHLLAVQLASMTAAVARHFPPGTKASRPEGGYFLWVECPAWVDTLRLHREACALNISVAPGPMFSARGDYRNCIRLNYGHDWNVAAERAVATLGALASRQRAGPPPVLPAGPATPMPATQAASPLALGG